MWQASASLAHYTTDQPDVDSTTMTMTVEDWAGICRLEPGHCIQVQIESDNATGKMKVILDWGIK